ncbi:molybdate ABC transporter substrate-binding protein [Verminephrobacter aporrectodeae]|uniref:molybdate ABC transporter substrate-binding protein n=1 Tax=Verminephrobacter aporrectodeae TaxID=1110389 RepID=UPI002242F462|nr:molybdate ABC transporter substrate-binding protein [Verminephrobacter aporrectodeae]MCW8176592.1 molybdate ABC transporter substrate-binding protein [Verminephrobacter aporrectodeae subsp. tuberculatae]MCW8204251.1 molybdate ABC transporter substrate-binding protein [Verminephrobacter aporrectodeae subsp. tuberculatae]
MACRSRATAAIAACAMLLGACSTPTAPGADVDADADAVQVYAAGSLRPALTEIAREHQARTGQKVALTFGASGLLRERIEKGAPAQLFASANTAHPERLAAGAGWQAPVVFARNTLCALGSEKIDATPDTLLATLLRSDVRVGTSTPRADPSGDYAWEFFRRADALRPGAYALLDAKALKLTGGADSPTPPAGRNAYLWLMEQDRADVLLTYCTNAVAARAERPRLRVLPLPPALQVGAAYAMTLRQGAAPAAQAFALALRQPAAQAALQRLGFELP